MKKLHVVLISFLLCVSLRFSAQVGTLTGWGMAICNTYSFNICPGQSITPLNYGAQFWVCNNSNMPDVSFTIMGPGWRVAKHNYTFTANTNGQIAGFDAFGVAQTMPFSATQSITPSSYPIVGGNNCVIFAVNGSPTTYTFNQNTFSISITPVTFGGNSYTLCTNTTPTIAISPTVPAQGGPWNYSWQPGGLSGSTVAVSPTVNTTYTVTATVVGTSCSNTATISVTPTNCCTPPVITATASQGTICAGRSCTLTASGAGAGGTYTMNPGNLTGGSAVVSPTATTIYTVSGTNSNGCTGTTTIQVTVSPLPAVAAAGNAPLCAGSTLSLSVNAASSYTWSGPGGFSSGLQNPVIGNAQPSNAGIYTVTVANAVGCVNTATVNVVINPQPSVTATNSGSHCQGGTVTLSVSPGSAYSWSGPSGFTSNVQQPVLSNLQPVHAGVYNATVTFAGGCQGTAATTVTVNPLTLPSAGNAGPVCVGQPVTFSAGGAVTYTWSGPGGFASTFQNPQLAAAQSPGGTYTVFATDAAGCTGSATTALVVNALPVINVTHPLVCEGQAINLSAGGGGTYSWSGPSGFSSALQNPVIGNAQPAMSGTYTVTVTSGNGCTASAVSIVSVHQTPTLTVIASQTACVNTSFILHASSANGNNYSWTGPGGFSSAVQNPSVPGAQAAGIQVYSVTVSDNIGCTASGTSTINVFALPQAGIQADKLNGCAPLCINLSPVSSSTIQGCSWQFGDGSSMAGPGTVSNCYALPGHYTVTLNLTDANGCSNSAVLSVEAYPKPTADFIFYPDQPLENDLVDFKDLSYGAPVTQWMWSFSGMNGFTATSQNVSAAYENAGTFVAALVVSSANGCSDTLVKPVVVAEDFALYVPDAFTPNDDGFNDLFQPKGYGIAKYELIVFDRWGEELFKTKDFSRGWNGTRRGGEVLKNDIYVWKIIATGLNGKTKEYLGNVMLIK